MIKVDKDLIMQKLIDVDAKTNILSSVSDIRNSDTFALIFQDQIRYVPKKRCWFYYDGTRWIKDDCGLIASFLCKELCSCLIKYCKEHIDEDDQYAYLKTAIRWQKRTVRDNIIRDAMDICTIDANDFDTDPYLINLTNGTFNLKTGLLQPHCPDDLITKLAQVEYKSDVFNDRWNSFILEIMNGDSDRADYLQRILGCSLSGKANQECMYVLYGASTRNGKGTLMESVLGVLGDYGRTVRPETLATSNVSSNSHSEDIARLQGVRLANISEPPMAMKLNSALVKTLTGGDTINARFLNENSFDYKPQFKIYVSTNHLPQVNDATVFASNRIVVVPFDKHFTPEEQDKGLKSFFATQELKSAIFLWLVEGYFKSLVSLDPPKSVQDATDKYHYQSDDVYYFLHNAFEPYELGYTPVAEVHRQYTIWATANGRPPLVMNVFSKKIARYGNSCKKRINGVQIRCFSLM